MSVGTFRHGEMDNSDLAVMYEEIKLQGKVALADKKLSALEVLELVPLALEVVEKAPGVSGEQKRRLAARLIRDLAASMNLRGSVATRLNYVLAEPYLENIIDISVRASKGDIDINKKAMEHKAKELIEHAKAGAAKVESEAKHAAMGILEEARKSARSIKEANLEDLAEVASKEMKDMKEVSLVAVEDVRDTVEETLDEAKEKVKKSRLRKLLICL